jgi:hypothetical protein
VNELRQRQPHIEDPAHLAYVRTLPCTICAMPGSDPAHIRTGSRKHGKRDTGMGEKPDDCWVLPLCRHHHMEQHSRGDELAWWASYGIPDPFVAAIDLYASRSHKKTPKQERRQERKTKPRNPAGERRTIPAGKPLESRSNWPAKGTRKVLTRKDHQ